MKIKELMKILEKCNPEAIVTNIECRNYSSTIYYWQPTVDGMFVLEKIMGLILAGMSVQLILNGLSKAGLVHLAN